MLALCSIAAGAADRQSDANDNRLEEVIVTADKLGRSLFDTPASTAVLDQKELERRGGLTMTRDVLATMPNIVIPGTGNIAPTIRGIDGTGASQGADAFFAGSRPRLNMQVDGRSLSYNEIVFGDSAIWDVKQVEVLRGAQSTLQGRNAIAGTIVTKTNDPTFTDEMAFRVGGGNYEQRRASAVVSGPIVDDSVAFRLSADWLARHSFVEGMVGFPGVQDPADFQALTVRGKLLFEPQSIEGLRTLVTLNHSDYSGPQTENVARPFGSYRTDFPPEPVFQPKTTSLIVDSSYDAAESPTGDALDASLRLEGVLSATDLSVARKSEPGGGIVQIDGHEYAFEPRLRIQSERISGLAGVYLFRAQQDESIDFPSPQAFDDEITTAAVFGEATWSLTDSLDLIAGMRYEEETHERHGGDRVNVAVDLDETYRAFLPKLGLAWHVASKSTVGVIVSRGYNGGGGGFTFDENTLLFTNYQYDPEYVWTGEIYLRQEIAEGRGRLTANVFYSDYKDAQLSYDLTPLDPTDFSFIVKNAQAVETYGAEIGGAWLPVRGLELYASAGVLHAKVTKYPGSGFQGNELPFAPSFTASAGIVFNREQWDAGLNTRYASSYYSDIENNPRGNVDPYFVANIQVGYTVANVRLYGYVNNLLDSDKAIAIYQGAVPEEDGGSVLTPRTYWLGAQMSF